MINVIRYVTESGKDVFGDWLDALVDRRAVAKVLVRIDRLAAGNLGDCKPVGAGVWELRIDWGPGYRVYYAMAGQKVLLLLSGGSKRRQSADIKQAIANWSDYQRRSGKP